MPMHVIDLVALYRMKAVAFWKNSPEEHLDRTFAEVLHATKAAALVIILHFDRMHGGFGCGSTSRKNLWPATCKKERNTFVFATKTAGTKVVEQSLHADFVASNTSNLQAGQKVEHQNLVLVWLVKWKAVRTIQLLQCSLN
jgi:DNA helicase-2/ATP-dependent DNA helicase PcrA